MNCRHRLFQTSKVRMGGLSTVGIIIAIVLSVCPIGEGFVPEVRAGVTESSSIGCDTTATNAVEFENDYFRVMRNKVACAAANTPGYGTRVIVALGPVIVDGSAGRQELGRGGVAVFGADQSCTIADGDFFEVAIKRDHPPLLRPDEWIEPLYNDMVHEDSLLRVFEERLPPGGDRPLHSHAQRLVVRLNEVQLTDPRFQKKVKPGTGIQVPNTVKFAEPIVHAVRNLSDIPLFNIVIEFKANGKP